MNSVHLNGSEAEMSRIIENPKALIMKNARKLLYEEGYSELNIRKIAKLSKIATGTVYNYYPTKKDLVMEMMMGYWEEFFTELERINGREGELFARLRAIFEKLGEFVGIFKEIWLDADFYSHGDYVSDGVEKERLYMERLVRRIERMLPEPRSGEIDSREIAGFVIMNFITMIRTKGFDYEVFEKILKKLV